MHADIGADAQRQIDGLVLERSFVADLQAQCVEVNDGLHRLQRPLQPLRHFLYHFVRDDGNQHRRHLGPVQFEQVALNLTHDHYNDRRSTLTHRAVRMPIQCNTTRSAEPKRASEIAQPGLRATTLVGSEAGTQRV